MLQCTVQWKGFSDIKLLAVLLPPLSKQPDIWAGLVDLTLDGRCECAACMHVQCQGCLT